MERAIPRPIDTIYAKLSPDEGHILLGSSVYDLTRGTLTPLPGRRMIWHPDGRRLTGPRDETGSDFWWIPADGSGAPEPLPTTERGASMSWSPDGRVLAYLKDTGGSTGNEIWLLSLSNGGATARRLVPGPVTGRAEFSPDGRYLAYDSRQSGRNEVYVQSVSGPTRRVTISNNGGAMPAWAGHGRELFYLAPGGEGTTRLMAVDVTLGESFSAGVPRRLFEIRSADYPPGVGPVRPYDVARDGTRFLMARRLEDSVEPPIRQIVIVQNWIEELKRMAAAK
jgi:Tol biopolymer transport system component